MTVSEIVMAVVPIDVWVLEYATESLKVDGEFVIAAMS